MIRIRLTGDDQQIANWINARAKVRAIDFDASKHDALRYRSMTDIVLSDGFHVANRYRKYLSWEWFFKRKVFA